METAVYLTITGIVLAVILLAVFKLRSMPQYRISQENSDAGEKWFVKVRKGFSYYYINQTQDLPGYANDVFELSKNQIGGQETERLAEKLLYNHRLTTIDGIEREGE